MPKEIQLTQGQVAIVCDCHYHLVCGYKWHAHFDPKSNTYYARRATSRRLGKQTVIQMHAVINNTPKGFHTDHENHSTLDNQCSNLRTATPLQNRMNQAARRDNTSGYKGVTRQSGSKKWRARIQINGKIVRMSGFSTAEEAARAYDAKARELFGEFAVTNF